MKAARGNRKEMIQKILSETKGVCRKREYRAASVVAKSILFDLLQNGAQRAAFSLNHGHYAFRVIVNDSDTCYRVLGQSTACTSRVRAA